MAGVRDMLTIASDTLADGTAVDVEFDFAAARIGDAIHTAPPAELGIGNLAGGNLTLVLSLYDPNTSVYLLHETYTYAVGTDGFFQAEGIWAGPSGQDSIILHPTVGETVLFNINLSAFATATAQPTLDLNTGNTKSTSGTAGFCGSALYGMSAQTAGVSIVSELTGTFPGSGGVDTNTAIAFVPDNPLPEPSSLVLLASAGSLLTLVRRRRGSRAD